MQLRPLLVTAVTAATLSCAPIVGCSAEPASRAASAKAPGPDGMAASGEAILEAVAPEITTLMADPRIRSVSGAVVQARGVHTFHYGRLPSGEVPNDRTLYEIGSLTKTFTGLLLAQAVLEGRLDLDAPVTRYLPEIAPAQLRRNGKAVTLRHLATHMSGLPTLLACEDRDAPDARMACLATHDDQDFMAHLGRVELRSDPGVAYLYSNAGARLIGLLLERVYGAPYPDLIRQRVLSRISDPNIRCDFSAEDRGRLAMSERATTTCDGAGGLLASAPDLGRYLTLYLADMDAAAVRATTPLLQQDQFGRAYLWNTFRPETEGQLYHGGGTFNTSSWISLYPREGVGVFLVTPNVDEGVQRTLNERANAIAERVRRKLRSK